MDTRAFRIGQQLPHVRWFEVDLPDVVQAKEDILDAHGVDVTRGD